MKKVKAKKILESVLKVYAEPDDGSDESAELKLLYIRAKLKYLFPPSKEDEAKMMVIHQMSCARVVEKIDNM